MIKISVIIPVHNAANTIRDTLLSVMRQAGDDMEILLIDDCSQDDSVRIIQEAAGNDSRVVLLRNTTNLGVSATRNKGLAAARGEYVRFVDDDDPLPEGSINSMLEVAEANGSDLVIGIMERVRLGRRLNIIATAALGARKVINKYDPEMPQNFSVCNKMFRLDIIRDHAIIFRAYRHAEDGLFLFEYLQYAEKINGCNQIIYTYMRPETFEDPTATTNLDRDMLHDVTEVADMISAMHPYAPEDFVESFNRKIESGILIEKCYRQLWRLDASDVCFLLKELNKYRDRLSQSTWDDVRSKHPELRLEEGFFTKAEAAENPVFTIVVSPSMKTEALSDLLHSAYYQRAPLFRIILADSCRDQLPDDLRGMPNIVFREPDQLQHRNAVDSCETPYIALIDDPVIFTFETLTRAATLLQDEELGYVSGVCQRMGDEKVITPEVYRFAFAKESLGRRLGCSAQDRADMLISNKVFRTESLKAYINSNKERKTITAPKLAEALIHERTRKIRYMTECSDIRLRKKLIKESGEGSVLSAVRIDPAVDIPENNFNDKILFIPEKQELKPAFQNLYDSLQCCKEIFVRTAEEDPSERISKYMGYRFLLFENYDPVLASSEILEGQKCFVLLNYLCRDSATAERVLNELNNIIMRDAG